MLKAWIFKKVSFFKTAFKQLILKERSPRKLALSFSVGLYIAFSPFLFMHTIMIFVFSWLFSLNLPAMFVGSIVSNPWTVVPCSAAGYAVGEFFFRTICRLDPLVFNPSWMALVNGPIFKVTGIRGVSFWSFMVGGNLLGVLTGVMLYPMLKRIFSRLGKRTYRGAEKSVMEDYENSCKEQKSVSRLRDSRKTGSGNRADW